MNMQRKGLHEKVSINNQNISQTPSGGGRMGDYIAQTFGYNAQMEVFNEISGNKSNDSVFVNSDSSCDMNPSWKKSSSPATAVQDWNTPTNFPLCPEEITSTPIQDYLKNLAKGKVFSNNCYGDIIICDYAVNNEHTVIWVLGKNLKEETLKPWLLSKITFRHGKLYHENCGSYWEEKGGVKYFTLAQGKEWKGGDCDDDYC